MRQVAPEPSGSCHPTRSRPRTRSEWVASLRSVYWRLQPPTGIEDVLALLRGFTDLEMRQQLDRWDVWARDDQVPPAATASGAPWRTWLILGGRGAGKTRAGAGVGQGAGAGSLAARRRAGR